MPVSHPRPRARRAVIVGGVRTPFVRAFTDFLKLDAVDLGALAVRGLLDQYGVAGTDVDSIVWGGVVLPSGAPNVGREIGLEIGLPASVEAMTVSRACASGLQAVTLAAAAIERGEADVVVAGGGDSTSNAEVKMGQRFVHAMAPVALGKKMSMGDWMGVASQLTPFSEILPQRPQIAERSTGQLMGEAAEEMAARNEISRESQDELAFSSHQRAAAAWESGAFSDEVVAVDGRNGVVERDTMVRPDTSLEKLGKLRPVFAKDGTLTAGNSSALTDGAAAVLLMSETKARKLGLTPLAAFRSWSYVGVDPTDQLLIGPAIAMPRALERAGLSLAEMGLVDMHEAFAAQVLSVTKALASQGWATERLGRTEAVGTIPAERFNVLGGSLALGHPFAATGARMVTTMARQLHARDERHALLGICAAGGLGAAAVLERIG